MAHPQTQTLIVVRNRNPNFKGMKTIRKPLLALAFFFALLSCDHTKSNRAIVDLDDLQLNVKSAGIAYRVSPDNHLDSSHGLNYMVSLSIHNAGQSMARFGEGSFTLLDEHGKAMPSMTTSGPQTVGIDLNAIGNVVNPGSTEDLTLFYLVPKHGHYFLEIVSPVSGQYRKISLPAS